MIDKNGNRINPRQIVLINDEIKCLLLMDNELFDFPNTITCSELSCRYKSEEVEILSGFIV